MSLNMDVDHSGGPHNGRLYVTFTDAPVSHNDTNVYLMSSDNGGATWSTPVQVNDDATTNSQFQSALSVDQTTGYVGVTWLDARNAGAANNTVQEFGAISTDGGSTFLPNFQISAGTSNEILAPNQPRRRGLPTSTTASIPACRSSTASFTRSGPTTRTAPVITPMARPLWTSTRTR